MSEIDPKAFRDFEHAGWEALPKRYHDAFAALTSQAIEPLLDAVGVKQGMRVLDVASGPGYVAGAAAKRGANVTGLDFAAAMVAEAKRRYPGVEFREGDAEALPFKEASFDAVVMNFGLLHLGRPERALAEAHRVLRAGGKAAFTVWAKPEEARGFGIVLAAIEQHGNKNVALPPGPPFFRFSEPEEFRRSLRDAGFTKADVQAVPQVWRLRNPEELFEVMLGSTVRTGGLLRAQTSGAQQAIRNGIVEAASRYRKGGAVELPMPAVLASGVKS
jgi:SAM-dependent methyltransferase